MEDLTKLTDDELKALQKKYTYAVSKYKNLQLAKKVQLNSAYGALGNQFFRMFDIRLAEAITLSGQMAIKWIANAVNKYLNQLLDTKDVDFIIAIDTDSIYVNFERVVLKIYEGKTLPPTEKIVDVLDKFSEEKMRPFINKSYKQLSEYLNTYKQAMQMKRENIADVAIWTAKKRYIMNVYDNEGARLAEPDPKMMGIEAIKSSTPTVCRAKLKEAIKIILKGEEKHLHEYIKEFESEFRTLRADQVAFPRSVNGIGKWMDSATLYRKGTPIHVKGAIIYNKLLKEKNLVRKYPPIQEGDKIKYLYLSEPNNVQSKVIAIPGVLPEEMELNKFIDYDLQFTKAFLDPLTIILEAIGWSSRKQNTLDHLVM